MLSFKTSEANMCLQGWDDDGPNGTLIYLRNWTIGRKLKDSDVLGPKGFELLISLLSAMKPYVSAPNDP